MLPRCAGKDHNYKQHLVERAWCSPARLWTICVSWRMNYHYRKTRILQLIIIAQWCTSGTGCFGRFFIAFVTSEEYCKYYVEFFKAFGIPEGRLHKLQVMFVLLAFHVCACMQMFDGAECWKDIF